MHRTVAAALAALLLALGACHGAPPAADADPALWEVRDADTTMYLFGTVHVLKPGLGWFDEAVSKAFDASDTLVLELVMPDAGEIQALATALGTARDAPPLSQQLDSRRRGELATALAPDGIAVTALDGFEPWFAATTLSALPARRRGYSETLGAERVLTDAAKAAGKPILGLETAREQLGYFDDLSMPAQRALLDKTLDDFARAGERLDAMVAAWGRGDPDALAAMLNDDLAAAPELAERLLVARNRRWAEWIAARMAQPGTFFVAVGAGHLAGERSVIAQLRARGLTVTRLAY